MSDDNYDEDQQSGSGNTTASDVQRGVAGGLQAAQGAVAAAQGASSGNVAGAIGGLAGAAGGVGSIVGGEAGQAVRTGAQAVQTGAQLLGAAQQLAGGNVGGATSALGSATSASRYVVPDNQAQQVLEGVGQGTQAGGALLDGVGGALSDMTGELHNVEYHLELAGFDGRWGVRHVELHEQLSGPYECIVHARCDSLPEVGELLALDAHLQIERSAQMRSVHGFVKHAVVTEYESGSLVLLHIVPALWLLDQNMRSRVFTNKTVPQVVEAVFQERLGGRQRSIRNDLTRDYPVHELMVQFQETDLAFMHRRLEQEGIFYYFVHDGDHEELVLADTSSNLPNAREDDEGRVSWCSPQRPPPGGEGIHDAVRFEEVGAADVIVTEYNWTAPDAPIRGERTGRSDLDPPLEVYDHTDALLLHSYGGGSYGANDAAEQARMRAEVLDLRRKRWSMSSNVVAARPGHVIELAGCPDGALDGRYVIVSVEGDGSATEGSSGSYTNHLQVVPVDVPFRPARRTAIPVVQGFQSAVVVGPDGEEIHTDEHGRVQVRFPWDREHQPNEHNLCSCWMRVMHSWAGPGFGTTFIPRIGMEVVVVFLGGNPDKPIVMGCLYHGTNASPVSTPADKTQSVIRTKSSPNSEGFNELRFEDKAGSERIFTHAQKDYDEVVEQCHSTHVKVDQSNTVDHDHTETVGHDQTLHVKNDRTKNVDANEKTEIGGNRTEEVTGHEQIHVHEWRKVKIEQDDKLVVHANREMKVDGKDAEDIVGGRDVTVAEFDNLHVIAGANRNVEVSGQYNIKIDGHFKVVQGGTETIYLNGGDTYIEGAGRVQIKSDGAHLDMRPGGKVKLTASSFEVAVDGAGLKMEKGTIKLTGETRTEIGGSSSTLKLEGSGATISGSKVTSSASGINEITGVLVKIN